MKKDTVRRSPKNVDEKLRGDSPALLFTLSLWRLRQTWWQLLITGIALLAACALACVPTLFSSIADTAGLQGLLNGTPTRKTLALNVNANSISSATVSATRQSFEKVIRPGMGSYLDPSSPALVIRASKLFITQPTRLNHVNPLQVYATSIQRLRPALHLVQGRWASEQEEHGLLEIMLSSGTAQALHLSVGTSLTVQSGFVTAHTIFPADPRAVVTMRLVGIFADPTTAVPELHGATFGATVDYTGPTYTVLLSDTAFLQACDQIAAREQSTSVSAAQVESRFHLTWYYQLQVAHIQFGQIDDLTTRLTNVQYKVTALPLNGAPGFPYVVDSELLNPAPTNADLLSLLSQYTSQVSIVNLPISLLTLQTIALFLFFACVLFNQLIDRQMAMSAQLSSRGASSRQIIWSLLGQAVVLCILALVLGPLLGILLISKLAYQIVPVNEQTAITGVFSSPGHVLALIVPYLAGTFLVGLLAVGLPCRRASKGTLLELRNETARAHTQPFWLRYYLDLLAALLALSGFGVALYLAQVARVLDIKTQELVIAPLTLVTPLFLLLGCLLLFLRVFPLILRGAAYLARPARGLTSLLALVQMTRSPRQPMRLVMLLTLATTFALFTLVFSASQNQRALDIAAYESGADFSGYLPLEPGVQSLQDIALRYSEIAGVNAASAGYISTGTGTGLGEAQISIQLQAVDTSSFANVAIWGTQDSSQSLPALMRTLSQNAPPPGTPNPIVPAIVDQTALSNLHLAPGNTFNVTIETEQFGGVSMVFQVVAITQHIPGVNGEAGVTDASSFGGLLVDYQAFDAAYRNYQSLAIGTAPQRTQSLAPNYLWLRSENSPAALASVRTALSSSDLALGNLYDRRVIATDLQNDPLVFSILLLLSIGGITTLVLAFLGSILAAWLNARLRLGSFVVLRALGATRWQVVSIFLWEQSIVYLVALLLSLGLGGILTWLVTPQLVFTGLPPHGTLSEMSAAQFYLLQRTLPPQTVIPTTIILALLALIGVCVLALFLMTRVVLRASYGQELRLNED